MNVEINKVGRNVGYVPIQQNISELTFDFINVLKYFSLKKLSLSIKITSDIHSRTVRSQISVNSIMQIGTVLISYV